MSDTAPSRLGTLSRDHIVIAMVAAAVPVIVALYKFDIDAFPYYTSHQLIGYGIRTLGPFASALLVLWIYYPNETDRKKLFTNALAAPAVLSLALANAAPTKVASLSIVGIAHAQPHGELGAWQEHSAAVQIFQGLTGTVPRPTWWIWVASATTSADAVTLATRLNTQHPSLPKRFKAYPSPSGAGLFAVMLGDGFGSQQEAAGLAELARARGMQETPRIVEVRDRTPAR